MTTVPSRWANFLNSLATSGGNLFLLSVFSLILMFTTLFLMVKFGPGAPAVITMVASFSSFIGALIGILRGSRIDTPPNTTVDQTITTRTVPPTSDEPPKT
jgi:hypothetical protein